ncbi:MAG TPA: metallophosphoesterase, partial [Gemmataceae bacterium]|nr:metallophosphoesterase [Gemmataceae bacterium]
MPRLLWTTDLHWDRLDAKDRSEFEQWVRRQNADGLILSGDIGEASCVCDYLSHLHDCLGTPIYFVLGNHDFYHGSFEEVHASIRELTAVRAGLHWLSEREQISLGHGTALVGHEGWSDARYGDYDGSRQWPRDFIWIRDLAGLSAADRRTRLHALGDRAAEHLWRVLPPAAGAHREVICVTHVPPYREACVDEVGRVDEPSLPFYTCKAVGDVLSEVAEQFPDCQLTVLCGHTHNECAFSPRTNL